MNNKKRKRTKSRYKLIRFWNSLTTLGKVLVLVPVFLLLLLVGVLSHSHTRQNYAPAVYTYLVQAGYT